MHAFASCFGIYAERVVLFSTKSGEFPCHEVSQPPLVILCVRSNLHVLGTTDRPVCLELILGILDQGSLTRSPWAFCCLIIRGHGIGIMSFISNWHFFLWCCNFLTSKAHLVGLRTSSLTVDFRCVSWSIISYVTVDTGSFVVVSCVLFPDLHLKAAGDSLVYLIMRLHLYPRCVMPGVKGAYRYS